ncbi:MULTISPECIES: hypothetical protein [Flavobacteriaceae]|uniref:Uncharacterized protein n=2 Tax=Flavobacteriaceae TaxID=49546 RepID=A0A4Y8AVT3_9FLAO|nr:MULTISPECIES: hypothetical protein [Flavobacteriaceae]TEW75480.1 hypothetical protein E2488_08195 [Gramella jeungdoensis]GGK45554.1 hypothetical protein GCM10007963_12240 [Lutibacter litoralis]
MKNTIIIGIILFIFPFYLVSQNKQIVWEYITPSNNGHTINLKKIERIVFYDDNSFESLTSDPGYAGGKGKYEVDNSIITCIYSDEIEKNKGYVEIINPDIDKTEFRIIVSNLKGENLPGTNVFLKSSQNELIEKITTNFDGVAIIPNKKFNKIIVEFIGYKSLEATISETYNTDLKFILGECCPELVIAKGSIQQFKIIKIDKKSLNLKQLNFKKVLFKN